MPDYEVKQPGGNAYPLFWKDPEADLTPEAIGIEIQADDSAAPLLVNGVNVIAELKKLERSGNRATVFLVGALVSQLVSFGLIAYLFLNH